MPVMPTMPPMPPMVVLDIDFPELTQLKETATKVITRINALEAILRTPSDFLEFSNYEATNRLNDAIFDYNIAHQTIAQKLYHTHPEEINRDILEIYAYATTLQIHDAVLKFKTAAKLQELTKPTSQRFSLLVNDVGGPAVKDYLIVHDHPIFSDTCVHFQFKPITRPTSECSSSFSASVLRDGSEYDEEDSDGYASDGGPVPLDNPITDEERMTGPSF